MGTSEGYSVGSSVGDTVEFDTTIVGCNVSSKVSSIDGCEVLSSSVGAIVGSIQSIVGVIVGESEISSVTLKVGSKLDSWVGYSDGAID